MENDLDTIADASQMDAATASPAPRGACSGVGRDTWVEIVADIGVLEGAGAQWRDLAAACDPANIFFEPWMVGAALALPEAGGALHLLVWAGEETCKDELVGYLPVQRRKWRGGLCPRVLKTWSHRLCYLGEPLVRPSWEAAFWRAVLSALDKGKIPAGALQLSLLLGASASTAALRALVAEEGRPLHSIRAYERALLVADGGYEDYLTAHIRRKSRKEYRRQSKRLSEMGILTTLNFSGDDDVDSWVDDFIDLEVAGWKGQAGTAIKCDAAVTQAMRLMARQAAADGRLFMMRLCLDGRTIAALFNIRAGAKNMFSLKTTYDEDLARYSPGVMAELEFLRHILDEDGANWVDSCAAADHPMIDSLWKDRLEIVSLRVPARNWVARLLCDLELKLVSLIRAVAAKLKRK